MECSSESQADMGAAWTLSSVSETIGIIRAATENNIPISISFTVETNGCLASRMVLGTAIEMVDAATDCRLKYYMVNCSYPSHFEQALETEAYWTECLPGISGNASDKSHAELDHMTELDAGAPIDLATRNKSLREHLPGINILGGCCGTDHSHVRAICEAFV
ncbi:homocysteine S-methyltransferase family protein [Rhizobium lusitanum]|uniref:homocysteine S-methyltransferase family protein n=1 Tax=Rhizobium lusitanum TaxID=293958 RepID=UPI0032B25C35